MKADQRVSLHLPTTSFIIFKMKIRTSISFAKISDFDINRYWLICEGNGYIEGKLKQAQISPPRKAMWHYIS